MKTITAKATAETAYGQTLPQPIVFEYSYSAFETKEEVIAANKMPTDEDIISLATQANKSSALQSARIEALKAAGYEKPTIENDAELRFRNMVKLLLASGKNQQEAETLARQMVG